LDLHSALTTAMLALNNTAGNQSLIAFVNNSVTKWRIGNTAANNFEILNVGLSAIALTINVSDNSTDLGNNSIFSAYSYLTGLTSGTSGQTNLKIGTTTAGVPGGYYSIVPLSSGVLNFSSNLSAGNYRIFNIDSNSLTDSTTRTFTLPNASGTIALTSNLSSYLPLAGGTLTGTLTGTQVILSTNSGGYGQTITNTNSGVDSNGMLIKAGGASSEYCLRLANIADTTTFLSVRGNGNVIINSNTDDTTNKLQVTGSIKATAEIRVDSATSEGFVSNSTNNASFHGLTLQTNGVAYAGFVTNGNTGEIKIGGYQTTGDYYPVMYSDGVASMEFGLGASPTVKIQNLAGTGSRAVLADANGVLSAPVSDKSIKENIEPLQYGLDTIMQLNPVQFEFIDTYKNYGEGLQIGNIAQEVEKIIPEVVFLTPSTGLKGIDYNQFHAIYIKAIQDQQKIIESLIERIEQLENK
jgi:hypothetical protein